MKHNNPRAAFLLLLLCWLPSLVRGQQSTSPQTLVVQGDVNSFYPVVWFDAGWHEGATELEIARPYVHTDETWRGSLISRFRVHVTNWGHGSSFIDAEVRHHTRPFVGGWADATTNNGTRRFIVWLRGATTYTYRSANAALPAPQVHDGVQHPLPFVQENGGSHQAKAEVDPYVNGGGATYSGTARFLGTGGSAFMGPVGVGTDKTESGYNLHVTKGIRTEKVQVDVAAEGGWADFVFDEGYRLRPLAEVEAFIRAEGHLPEVPSAAQVGREGIDLARMDALLLQKVEELTLHLIRLEKELRELKAEKGNEKKDTTKQ